MTELEVLAGIHFYCHVTAVAVCWLAGSHSLYMFMYWKNQRELW